MGDREIPLWARTGHQKPLNRREFLAGTVGAFSATLTVPSIFSVLLRDRAFADEINCPQGVGLIPFITINLSGGGALAGNFVPHTIQGERLESYRLLGLGNGSSLPVTQVFSNKAPFAGSSTAKISKIWQGIDSKANMNIQKNTAFVGIPCQSKDDSNENTFDISGLLSKAGLVGSLLPNIGTNQNTPTGVNCQAAGLTPPAPFIVNSFNSLSGALGYGGQLASLPVKTKLTLAKMIQRLSGEQARKLAQYSGGSNAKAIIDCAGIKNLEVVSAKSDDIDPIKNNEVATIWGLTPSTPPNSPDYIFSSIVFNAINGNASSVGLDLGGYDYHDGTRTRGDSQDLKAGELIGKILATANSINKSVFIYVVTDGAVTANGEGFDAPWVSDRGAAGCSYMLAFNPDTPPVASGFQLGGFTQAQVADKSFITGSSPQNAAFSAFANYLQLNKRIDLLEKVLPRVFSDDDLKKILIFS